MSLVTTPTRELATCPVCASRRVTAITMTLTDGSVVDFASCHACEHKAGPRPVARSTSRPSCARPKKRRQAPEPAR